MKNFNFKNMKKGTGLILGLFAVANGLFAQYGGGGGAPMAAMNSGDVSNLTKVRNVNIVYSYADLGVGAFRKEEDYLNKKCDDMKKKDPSACEKFRKDWVEGRKTKFEPRFELLFNKYAEKMAFMQGTNYSTNQDITLEVHTVFIEPGYNIGISSKPATIDMECTFKDKSGKILCVIFIKNAVGASAMGYDFDVTSRLVESYSKASKMLAALIKKERKKKKIKIEG